MLLKLNEMMNIDENEININCFKGIFNPIFVLYTFFEHKKEENFENEIEILTLKRIQTKNVKNTLN